MNFVRGLCVLSLTSASLSLAVACGSGPDASLFSSTGGASNYGTAGADSSLAGRSAAGATNQGYAGDGGMSTAGSSAGGATGESGSSGAPAGGKGSSGGASPGAGSGGMPAVGAGGASGGASAGGSSAGAASGGNTSGGNTSGGNTSGGSGGSAGADPCPVPPPQDKAVCDAPTPDSCYYAGLACSCLPTGSGPNPQRKWGCYGTPNRCPSGAPSAGSACKGNSGAECPYPNGDFCACAGIGDAAHWACQPPNPACNPVKPPQGNLCLTVRTCVYGAVACFCNGTSWGCEGGG